MNFLNKQLVMNDGRTLYEHAKEPKFNEDGTHSALDMSQINIGAPPPQAGRVSATEWEATMKQILQERNVIKTSNNKLVG